MRHTLQQITNGVCLVIGRNNCNHYSFIETIKRAVDGGITSVQLRDKTPCLDDFRRLTEKTLKHLPSNIPLVINDHASIAHEFNLPLHIGQSDMPYAEARVLMGPGSIIGLSIENMHQAKRDANCGANYFGVGPIFATLSKSNAALPLGLKELKKITDILGHHNCMAIGGIKRHNIADIANIVPSIAVISDITQDKCPTTAARNLMEYFRCNDNILRCSP